MDWTIMEDALAENIAKEMQREIDNEIMIRLKEQHMGYHVHRIKNVDEIKEWSTHNLKDSWEILNDAILILSDNDNNWFCLKWK